MGIRTLDGQGHPLLHLNYPTPIRSELNLLRQSLTLCWHSWSRPPRPSVLGLRKPRRLSSSWPGRMPSIGRPRRRGLRPRRRGHGTSRSLSLNPRPLQRNAPLLALLPRHRLTVHHRMANGSPRLLSLPRSRWLMGIWADSFHLLFPRRLRACLGRCGHHPIPGRRRLHRRGPRRSLSCNRRFLCHGLPMYSPSLALMTRVTRMATSLFMSI